MEEKKQKKKNDKPFMVKKAIESGTQGRKHKVLKGHIGLIGSNKMPTFDKYP